MPDCTSANMSEVPAWRDGAAGHTLQLTMVQFLKDRYKESAHTHTHTMTINTEAKINRNMAPNWLKIGLPQCQTPR